MAATKKTPRKVTRNQPKTIQDLVTSHQEAVQVSLKKHGLAAQLIVRFPSHARPPLIGRLGAWLVNKYGGIIDTRYSINDTLTSNKSRARRPQ